MIDHRDLSFDSTDAEGITLVQDRHLGLCLYGQTPGGFVLARLESEPPYEAHFFDVDKQTEPQIFVPNCGLRIDTSAVLERRRDPPAGSLIVGPDGISLMVLPPRSGPTPMRLTGSPVKDAYSGFCITKWRVESPSQHGKPEVLHSFALRSASVRTVPLGGV